MDTTLTNKIKDEILLIQKRRHEFCMRKLAFATGLLGVGSASVRFSSSIDLSLLLYLVPLVAISFDIHILTEDFRIKRAGEFILKGFSNPTNEEIKWEKFVRKYPSFSAPLQYCFVTLIITIGAGVVILKTQPNTPSKIGFFILWFILSLAVESILTWKNLELRRKLIS